MENKTGKDFYAGGFLYNPKTRSVLLHLRDDKTPNNPNKWAFFGGTNEGKESPKQCFMREFEEELGLKIKEKEIIELCDYFNENRGTWRYIFYIESDVEKSAMKLTEGRDFAWIPLNEAFEYDLTENVKKDLELFVKVR